MWLYSPVCVGPGQKPGRPVFSQRGSFIDNASAEIKLRVGCVCVGGGENDLPQGLLPPLCMEPGIVPAQLVQICF